MRTQFEVAIVGSGPGGAVAADVLSAAGLDVVLFEEGSSLPLNSCAPFSTNEILQKYRSGGLTPAFGAPTVSYGEGRCVGGGSEINWGMWYRTPADVLEAWKNDFGLIKSSPKDLEPHFLSCENDLSVSKALGPPPAPALKLQLGASALGWRVTEVLGAYKGGKQSMSETLIPRAISNGCTLVAKTKVQKLKRTPKGWWLTTSRGDFFTEKVFIAGGAIQTPALLRRSGIKKNIGNSLQMHLVCKMTAHFDEEVNLPGAGLPMHQVKEFSPHMSFGCSTSTPALLALEMNSHSQAVHSVAKDGSNLWSFYVMLSGSGRGSVRTLPGFQDPLVRYKVSQSDLEDLSTGLKRLGELLFKAGATTLYPGISGYGPIKSMTELSQLPTSLPPSKTNLSSVHLFSSCPAGEVSGSATDSFGKVIGHTGLYISDAGILCGSPGVNPQGTIMALARRNALHFLNAEN